MSRRKYAYVAYVVMPDDSVSPERHAELTEKQAKTIADWLDKKKTAGAIKDYYLGSPLRMERLHTPFFNADGLRAVIGTLIEDYERLK